MAAQQYRTINGGTASASSNPSIGYLLEGTSLAHEAVLETGPGSRTIAFVDQYGTPGHEVYGAVADGYTPTNTFPLNTNLTITHGVTLSYGNLEITGDQGGGVVTLDGASTVTNHSALTTNGAHHLLESLFDLNGSMTVSNQSTADFRPVKLEGGTVNVEAGSVVDMNTVLAGLHVNVAKGGYLLLQSQNPQAAPSTFRGTINEAAGGTVLVYGAQSAVREIFHTATGTLDLLNKAGTQIASLQFAPGSREYTEVGHAPGGPANNQFAVITTTPTLFGQPAPASVALPAIFTH